MILSERADHVEKLAKIETTKWTEKHMRFELIKVSTNGNRCVSVAVLNATKHFADELKKQFDKRLGTCNTHNYQLIAKEAYRKGITSCLKHH